MRFTSEQLPDVMRRLRLPSLEIVQRERWTRVDGGIVRGDISVDAPRTPISGFGSVELTPAGSGTELVGTADVRQTVRSVPELAKAVTAAVRVARAERDGLATSVKSGSKQRVTRRVNRVVVPNAVAFFDVERWDERARALGGSSNSLFAALGARLSQIMGRVADDGMGRLLPVSERGEDDFRANAVTEATVQADPDGVTTDLSTIRRDVKRALTALGEAPTNCSARWCWPPSHPRFWSANRKAWSAGRQPHRVFEHRRTRPGCQPSGRQRRRPSHDQDDRTQGHHDDPRSDGRPVLVSGRVHGHVFVTVASWVVGGPNTREALRDSVRRVFDDMAPSGTVE